MLKLMRKKIFTIFTLEKFAYLNLRIRVICRSVVTRASPAYQYYVTLANYTEIDYEINKGAIDFDSSHLSTALVTVLRH